MINWISEISKPIKAGALSIGSFDGVHHGHRALVEKTISEAQPSKSFCLSFSPHPREFFTTNSVENNNKFLRIFPEEVNASILRSIGLDDVYYVKFDKELASKNTSDFLNYVKNYIDFSTLVVGFDFRLGSQRQGGQEDLALWCEKNNVKFVSVDKVSKGKTKISSTLVRKAVLEKDFSLVKDLLGQEYFLEGVPYGDKGLGGKLGFPTLNLKFPENLVLSSGVYAALVQIDTVTYHSVVNFGRRPTVDEPQDYKILEAHILESEFKSPKQRIKVVFKSFLRAEKKFENLQDLSLQVKADILKTREFFSL